MFIMLIKSFPSCFPYIPKINSNKIKSNLLSNYSIFLGKTVISLLFGGSFLGILPSIKDINLTVIKEVGLNFNIFLSATSFLF